MIKILIGGSPCTHWSIAQKNNRETEPSGVGWELFKNFLIAKEKFNPDYFLYENNRSASSAIKNQISKELGVELMYINSALVSAQKRERFYAFNWEVDQPKDRNIVLENILTDKFFGLFSDYNNSITYEKARTIGASCGTSRSTTYQQLILEDIKIKKMAKGGQKDLVYKIDFNDGTSKIDSVKKYLRCLSPLECERLQTLPDNYTEGVSNTQRYKQIGNGWTTEVIIHILNGILKNISKEERIQVLSMYDGIGTGRLCLDKMGFTNIEYHSYEIDKYAIKIATKNYQDIIQHGDAFQLRKNSWKI